MPATSGGMNHAAALLGRVLLSVIFLWAGWNKVMAPAGTMQMFAHDGVPAPQVAFVVAVIVELGGGLAVLLGFRARLVGLVMAVYCVATATIAHYHPGDTMQLINFYKNICMAGGFLQLTAWGAGRWSIDRR